MALEFFMEKQEKILEIKVHPSERNIPVSLVHLELSPGRYFTMCGPLGKKTVRSVLKAIEGMGDTLTAESQLESDFEI